ncbi:MAG TPA: serine/threonine-protein kinase, partial [Kofleriaceae bacterium]|nr:serine/threonine-protein kinase [Kofleriaceae bacterium]
MAAEREDLRGRTVGEFVLRERIGRGGFGAVYRCEQPLLGREAVVKVLHRKLRHNDVVVQRFLREAQLASRLDHPYAAHVYAFGIEHADGLFWIAMERVQGTTLDRWLRDRGPLPLDRFVPFFERVAEVVQTAHERGIVHRDLKPSNVMVIERAGRLLPKLLDFGVAKLLVDAIVPHWAPMPCESDASTTVDTLDAAEPSGEWLSSSGGTEDGSATPPSARTPQPLTGANTTLGSPPYMSPEQWSDPGTVGPASDLYALGVMAYEALTGRRPFMAASVAELVELHCHAAVPPLGPELPPALDRVVQRALAKRPEDRWGSALELAGALRAASGLATGWTDLPRLDEAVRDAWLGDAPQPLAESVAALDGARNAHQACDATDELVRNLVRYLLAVALATCAQVREDRADPEVLDRVRAMRRGDLAVPERIELLRALVRPLIGRRGAHPVPELVDLVTPHADGSDELDPILALQPLADRAGADDIHRTRLVRFMPELTQLLRRATFVLDHGLVVPRNQAAEQWSGLRRRHRGLATVVGGELVDGHPMLLGGDGRICIDLWPLVQAVAPTEGAELELFLFDGRGRHGARLVAAPAGFEHHDPGVWEWIAARILGETAAEPVTGSDDQPPYLGLTPFATADAARFVGREAEVDAFLNRLRQKSLQVVFGPSGAGKSSFVHAGVIPGLPPGWRTVTMRPGGAPLTTLAARLAAANLATGDVRAALETSPASVVAQVFQASQGGTTVFVIDQLEELFTLCGSAERLQFATVIAQLVASVDAPVAPVASIAPGSPGSSGSSGSSIRVICTIRDDFLVQLDALAPLRPLLSPALVLLGNPSREALVRIIVEPARRAGYALSDPELAQDMVSAVADRPGALALVSFTASQLWELRDRQIRQLTRTAYEAMGGVGGALGRHAEATLDMLSADEQKLAREIFRHLVTADGTRARATVAELEHRLGPPPVQAMIDKLVATRLVTLTGPEGEPSVELMQRLAREVFRHMVIADGTRARATVAELEHRLAAPRVQVVIDKLVAARLVTLADSEDTPSVELIHEALIATWPRLQQWVREDVEGARLRDQIRVASRHWQDRDRPRGLLWGEDVLAELERWLRRSVSVTLSELETAFVAASRKVAHRARRLRRLLRLAALGVVGIVLLGATQYRSAAKISVANQLAEQRLTQSYVEQGRLALLEGQYTEATAYFGYVQKRGGDSPAVQFMLAQATQPLLAEIWRLNSASGRMWIGAFSRDGRRIVTTDDQGARVWEARSGKLQYTLPHADAVFDAVFSSGSETLITAGGDGFVKVWDMSTGSLVRAWTRDRPDGGHTRYYRVAMTPDGRLVAALDYRGDLVEVWDEHTGELAAELSDEAASSGSALAFSADGRWLASSGRGETTRVFDTRTWKLAVTLPARQVNCLKFDPTGPRLATGSMLGDASLWDIPSGQRIRHLHEMGEKVNDV